MQRQSRLVRAGQEPVLADAGLDALGRVEVAVLAQQARAERRDEPVRVAARAEVRRDELAGLVDLLLAVEQVASARRAELQGHHPAPASGSRVAGTFRKRSR